MSNLTTTVLATTVALALGGCVGFGDEECTNLRNQAPGFEPANFLRNPDTGLCESLGGGGGGGTDCNGNTVDVANGPSADFAFPAWGTCYGACQGLNETSCHATAGCQAAYVDDCHDLGQIGNSECGPATGDFFECWEVAPTPAIDVVCEQIADAYTCSSRDDCVKVHYRGFLATGAEDDEAAVPQAPPDIGSFAACASEPGNQGCYSDEECGPGYDCTAETECLDPPHCTPDGPCEDVCYGRCVPNSDVGQCFGVPVCAQAPPACPETTLPGHDGSCWTGYCIPVNECEAAPACSSIVDESQCVASAQGGCVPIYEGGDCTCDGDQCTCNELVFTSCVGGTF